MKWARPKLLRDVRSSEQKAHDELCFRFYSKDEMKAMFGGTKNIWKRHTYPFKFNSEDHYLQFQQRYEMFVGGYLYFYDERTRSGAIDTILYFKWSPFQKSFGEYTVTIYIWPAPLKKRNGKVLLSKSNRIALASANGGSKKANGGVQLLSASAKTMEALGGDEDTGDPAIDPPPPPPPPPPPFQ